MQEVWINLGVVLIFVLIGGFFAASEMALVSLREAQVRGVKERYPRAGRRLANLYRDPNRFLAAVQVGVTLAGFLSAGFGASRISPQVSPWFQNLGLSQGLADTVSFVLITIFIAYLSLVLGELVPKRLALRRSEAVAVRVAGSVDLVARLVRPFIWLLSVSTDALVRLLGGDPKVGRERMTEEELRGLVAGHVELSDRERELIDDVFDAGDRQLREVIVPRTEVDFMRVSTSVLTATTQVSSKPHSRYPVINKGPDDVVGFVHVRDLLDPSLRGSGVNLGELTRPLARFPGSKRVIPALTEMREGGHHLAIVVDEYGDTDGIVTMEDLVEELVGEITDEYDSPDNHGPPGLTGEREIDGLINLEDFSKDTGLLLPDGAYETVTGFVVNRLGRLPKVGDRIVDEGTSFTVLTLDGRRIERILVEPTVPREELEALESEERSRRR